MKRRIVLAILATLVLATMAIWVRSYYASDVVSYYGGGKWEVAVGANPGVVVFGLWMRGRTDPTGWKFVHYPPDIFAEPDHSFIGFGIGWEPATHNARLPLWCITLCLAAAMALAYRRRSIAPGHCPYCGYDLRATPERCPECGRVPEKIPENSD